jgi:hypothetical protein
MNLHLPYLALSLLALADLACTKTVAVVRVGFDCPLEKSDAGSNYLPFGRRLQAVYPRYGKATLVEVLDQGKSLGKIPASCVAATVPTARTLHVREIPTSLSSNQATASSPERHYVQENNHSYTFDTKHALEGDSGFELRLQPGQAVDVFGDDDSFIVVDKGIPLGIVPAFFFTSDAEAYFATHYDEYARNPYRQTRALSSAKTLDRKVLSSPRVAQAIPENGD